MNIKELMLSSKNALEGKWLLAIGTFFIYTLISSGLQASADNYPLLPFISLIISGPLTMGVSKFSLHISRNKEARFEDIFSGFNNFINTFLAYILSFLIILGGLILFIIPGIIAILALSMTFFILAEDSAISAIDAMKKSRKLMEGHKMEYFLLLIIYLMLLILCILTLGIGLLWLIPYIYVTNAKFYDRINSNVNIDILE